jgi:hypothetical protein
MCVIWDAWVHDASYSSFHLNESFLKGLLGLASSLETIPDPPYGDDSAGMAWIWFDLLHKPPDMDRHGVVAPQVNIPPEFCRI